MATDAVSLVSKAIEVRRRLEQRGLIEEAGVVAELVHELTDSLHADRRYYTAAEAAAIIGVSAETVEELATRGIIQGLRLGSSLLIPRNEVEGYRPTAEALKAIEQIPIDELIGDIRAGRRPVIWPESMPEHDA